MRTYVKLVITGLLAAAALAALVGSASANRLSITNRNIRAVWTSLEFLGPVTIRCRATLEGTLHSNTINKVEALVGYITAARIGRPCTGGSAWAYNGTEVNEALPPPNTLPTSLPWHVVYANFMGSLPGVTGVEFRVGLARFLYRANFFGINLLCVYRSSPARGLLRLRANLGAGGVVTSLEASGTIESETLGCPEGEFNDSGTDSVVTLLGTATRISITLI